ncbi:MAG: SpoIIE family protein phosphatase [Acidiferrobacterales bacterium]|nr:SpoIIE family protein phosphatase [Acidiferrobacterales bacterium]
MSANLLGTLSGLIKSRIFYKYILATLLIGIAINGIVLAAYFQHRQNEQTGQIAAELATIANRISRPASNLTNDGKDVLARELLAVFGAYSYVICTDLFLEDTVTPAVSWPIVGCARIKKPGNEISIALSGVGPQAKMQVRINPAVLQGRLRNEFGVLALLGSVGGLALILAGIGAFLWFINRPLKLLLSAIERFEKFDDPQQVAYTSTDEIGKVVSSYNTMLNREVERVTDIRDAHRSILDSVTYATRIQHGLLPTAAQLSAAFSDYGVLWQPRDLVGGDIYWIHVEGKCTTVAIIDCTGHGVPGGFMTMLAIASLERIFSENQNLTPGEILTRLSDLTRGLLKQDLENPESNDGMDAAICQFDATRDYGVFAGARQSVVVWNENQTTRLKGDRLSLGYPDSPAGLVFEEKTFPVDALTRVFLYTDGVTDQIGGPQGIAFGYSRLADVIKANASKDLDDILQAVEQSYSDYAGNEARRDDFTLFACQPKLRDE